jgi:hypothetical protein
MSSELTMDDQRKRRQRSKNLAIGAVVAGLCLLFYIITIVRMGMR